MSPKIIDNDLVAISKNKVTLTLKKPAYIRTFILELVKYECTNYIMITLKINMVTTQDFYSQILLV